MHVSSNSGINPGILCFLKSVAGPATVTRETQTEAPAPALTAAPAPVTRETQTEAPAPALTAAPAPVPAADEELIVYMPWTGLILELFCMRDEQSSEDTTFTSTLSVSDMKAMLAHGARPHVNQRCFQGFIVDVRMQVQRIAGFVNQQCVSYTPVYSVWLPADGSLFEVSGLSLPSPANRSAQSSWSSGEILAMESYALGEVALENGFMGDEYTWIPVLCKSCRTRVCVDITKAPVKYPPSELRTSRELPGGWQQVLTLPHGGEAHARDDGEEPARRVAHVGHIAEARQLAFTPVLLRDVLACDAEPTDEHRALYRASRDRFLAYMRPLFEVVTGGGDPRAQGWTQLIKHTERGDAYEWIFAHAPRKRKAEEITGSMTTQTIW